MHKICINIFEIQILWSKFDNCNSRLKNELKKKKIKKLKKIRKKLM